MSSYQYKYVPRQQAMSMPIQLQSVKSNDLYNRRSKAKLALLSLDMDILEDDRFPTIPDEFTPTRKIQAPPSFINLAGPTKIKQHVRKTQSIGVN